MPWKINKKDGQFCVVKEDTGEEVKCHPTPEKAAAHMKALYASENKELPPEILEEKCMDCASPDYYPLFGATSFAELDDIQNAQEEQMEITELSSQFSMLASNILADETITNKGDALKSLADEYSVLVKAASATDESSDSTNKENDGDNVEKAVWTTAYVNNLPDSAFLFVESGGKKDAEGKTEPRSKRHFPYKDSNGNVDLPHLRNAIARIPQSNAPGLTPAKKKALQDRARKMLSSTKKETNIVETVKHVLKEMFGTKEEESESLMIWKEANGQYRWFARYSNNFRDNDNPPEIISESSHKRFVERVDKGITPMPEMWLWHVPEWKIGHADWVAYDDSGFALASGLFDKDKSDLAEFLMSKKDVGVSHGMPKSSIKYADDDPSVIVEHDTVEISPLPMWAAANKLTAFDVIIENKEATMPIPTHKKEDLINKWGLDAHLLDKLEASNATIASQAKEIGIESKETAPVVEPVTTPVEEPTAVIDAPTEVPVANFTDAQRQEIADAFANVVAPIVESIQSAREMMEALSKEINATQSAVKELQKADGDKIADSVKNIPSASLSAILAQSVIGRAEARVTGKENIAKSKPVEAEDEPAVSPLAVPIPFINRMITNKVGKPTE